MRVRRLLCAVASLVVSAPVLAAEVTAEPVRAATPVDEFARCDPIDPSLCLFPFPNDYFTEPDETTDTGLRIGFDPLMMPRNVAGKPIDPAEWNRNDGFSPGSMILTHVPGLDLDAGGAVPITDMARAFDKKAPVVVINSATGERHLIWTEMDANATSEADRALIIRPGVNFEEGTRYVVALRHLRNTEGGAIEAGDAFKVFRDREPSTDPAVEERRPAMERIFTDLKQAGIKRKSLYLAWDFTVASERNLTERMLHIRDDAFADLGDAAPEFEVTGVTEPTPEEDPKIARIVEGTFVVPNYLSTPGGLPGSRFNYVRAAHPPRSLTLGGSDDGLPARFAGDGTVEAGFTCIVPRSAGADDPARLSLYGHGLLGGRDEVEAGNVKSMAAEHNFTFCATDWIGMATEDVPNVATILADMSNFPTLADRVQQGMLDFLFLGRLMIHEQGLASDPAFQAEGGPLIDTSDLFYDGNSQGGIIGGALTAVAQDFTRAVLGVPAMNYSTLLNRSVDWEGAYAEVMYRTYPDKMEQQLIFALIQMLWDRAEANGYAHHMTDDPLPNTPAHKVLLHVAFADHQVANVAADVEARTIGAHVYQPALAPGRHHDIDPYYAIPDVPGFPFDGSAMVVWDSGTPTMPTTNTPNDQGEDPHGRPRAQVSARLQKATFLQTNGFIVDVCDGSPCRAP
ncbi:MAG: hypothetical protein ACRDKZ_06195 [Actinomycetota bacterium]